MADGSDAIADWPLLNALINTASGASWVSIHHGGGVGIGRSIHAGQVSRRRRHRAGGAEAGPGADQRPGHGRHPARRRGLRPGRRGRRQDKGSECRCARAARWHERIASSGCGGDRADSAATAGHRRLPPLRPDPGGPRPARVVRRRGGRARPGPDHRPDGQPVGLVGRPGRARPASSPARIWTACPTAARTTGRSAWSARFAALDLPARAGIRAGPPDRHRQLRRRGRRPVRGRLRRLPGDHRRDDGRPGTAG